MEPNNCPIRIPIIINRLPRSNNLIRQRHEVPNRRARPNILEIRPTLRLQTLLPKRLQLRIGLRHTRVKLHEFPGIAKLCRDGLVDGPDDGVIPKRCLFRGCTETDHVAGALSGVGESGFGLSECRGKIIRYARDERSGTLYTSSGPRFKVKVLVNWELRRVARENKLTMCKSQRRGDPRK